MSINDTPFIRRAFAAFDIQDVATTWTISAKAKGDETKFTRADYQKPAVSCGYRTSFLRVSMPRKRRTCVATGEEFSALLQQKTAVMRNIDGQFSMSDVNDRGSRLRVLDQAATT